MLRRFLFLTLLATAVVTWFTRDRLASVSDIHPDTLREPVQTPVKSSEPVRFTRNGYEYTATPLFDYTLCGLVVHRLDYSWFSIDRGERTFTLDIGVIWGSNLSNRVHQAKSIRFSQDRRFCFVEWHGQVPFVMSELSNNHLLVDRNDIERKVKQIQTADQIRLRGKLVNVTARRITPGGRYDSDEIVWKSSTTRADTGGGACETILVEDVVILKPANEVSRMLFRVSLWGMAALALWAVSDLFRRC
jgi:hypothetical protein